ncbi:hypothetical protein TRIUR3_13423 [Triticum urartu]|uniref:Uncharacterized protein n=1 Tax=Triticum urartu TaxID=4572 RepID=M7ZH85_TRIUA|nr:hypothetical protein TRIUR3_13423 [Triticum urartu]
MEGSATMTVREGAGLYSVARQAGERVKCGNPEQAQNAVALLVWLDQGTISAIHHVPGIDAGAVAIVAEEANAILECLRCPMPVLPPIPLISTLCIHGGVYIEPGFFSFHQDLVVRGVAHFLEGAGKLVFDDRLNVLLRRSETGLVGNPPELMAPYSSLQLSWVLARGAGAGPAGRGAGRAGAASPSPPPPLARPRQSVEEVREGRRGGGRGAAGSAAAERHSRRQAEQKPMKGGCDGCLTHRDRTDDVLHQGWLVYKETSSRPA